MTVVAESPHRVRRLMVFVLGVAGGLVGLAAAVSYVAPWNEAEHVVSVSEVGPEGTLRFGLIEGWLRVKLGAACSPPFAPARRTSWGVASYAVAEFPGPQRGYRVRMASVNLWALAVLLSAYPLSRRLRGAIRRGARHRQGRCSVCGYNLSGNVSGVCSECGTESAGIRSAGIR